MTDRNAGRWEDMDKKSPSVAAPVPVDLGDDTDNGNGESETELNRPFQGNDTPELLALYRCLMKLSRKGPLTPQPARVLVKLIQELFIRGEKL